MSLQKSENDREYFSIQTIPKEQIPVCSMRSRLIQNGLLVHCLYEFRKLMSLRTSYSFNHNPGSA